MLQSTVYRYRTPLLDRPTCHLKISFFTVHFHVASLFTFACKQGQGRGVQLHLSWHPGPRPQAHSDVYVCQPACNDQLTQQRWYRDAPLDVELPRYPTSYNLDPHPSPPIQPVYGFTLLGTNGVTHKGRTSTASPRGMSTLAGDCTCSLSLGAPVDSSNIKASGWRSPCRGSCATAQSCNRWLHQGDSRQRAFQQQGLPRRRFPSHRNRRSSALWCCPARSHSRSCPACPTGTKGT